MTCLAMLLLAAGCSTSAFYGGDGQIRQEISGAYRVVFPPIDIGKSGQHIFAFSGPPAKEFAPFLLRNDDRSTGARIDMTIRDESGRVYSHRTGVLGGEWRVADDNDVERSWRFSFASFALSEERQSRLSMFGRYELVVLIEADSETSELAAPAIGSVCVSF
jgi:hypothetical protein